MLPSVAGKDWSASLGRGADATLGANYHPIAARFCGFFCGLPMANELKPLDWLDIGLHCLFAALWAGLCGYLAGWGYSYAMAATGLPDEVMGWVIAGIFALAGIIGDWLFWVARERGQHGYGWGGRQSNWEWAAPAGVTVVAFGTVFAITTI